MIKINFALRKVPAGVGDSGDSVGGGDGFSLKNLFKSKGGAAHSVKVDDLRELPLTPLLTMIALGVLSSLVVEQIKTDEMTKEQAVSAKFQATKDQLEQYVTSKKALEAQKKEMEEVERLYRVKIQTIEHLASDRQGAAKTMESLSRLTPAEVWLTQFRFTDQEANFQGMAKSLTSFTDFIKSLNSSTDFTDASPVQALTQRDPVFGEGAASFTINARRQRH